MAWSTRDRSSWWVVKSKCYPCGLGLHPWSPRTMRKIPKLTSAYFSKGVGSTTNQEQCSKPWLVVLYRGLYYPLIWDCHKPIIGSRHEPISTVECQPRVLNAVHWGDYPSYESQLIGRFSVLPWFKNLQRAQSFGKRKTSSPSISG